MTEDTWMGDAYCLNADPEIFFPKKGEPATHAQKICARCPVQTECLNYAIDHNLTDGIWGGISPRQRPQKDQAHV